MIYYSQSIHISVMIGKKGDTLETPANELSSAMAGILSPFFVMKNTTVTSVAPRNAKVAAFGAVFGALPQLR